MKPIIGILLREKENKERNLIGINKEVSDMVIRCGGIPIGIIPNYLDNFIDNDYYSGKKMTTNELNEIKKIINLCDGIIIPGGSEFHDIDIKIIKYVHNIDLPCLGICAGMQAMGFAYNGKLDHIENDNHNKNDDYVHSVSIKKDSKIHEILNKNYILVNSRHNDKIINTDLDIVGYSDDIIEIVEDKNKKFFIGVQWHPESIIMYDNVSQKLIKEFIKKASN